MNPRTYTNAGVLLQGQVQQSPMRPAASALWWAANGADGDLLIQQPVAGFSCGAAMGRDRTEKVEVRGLFEKPVIDVLDAISMARRIDRNSLIEKVLTEWATQTAVEFSVFQRLSRGNPAMLELAGIRPDDGGSGTE